MDARPDDAGSDPVVVTGLGHVVIGNGDPPCDPMPYLKVKKLRKYMGVQDDLAVVAAAKALESAGLAGAPLGERTGLYLAVGYIPFEKADLDPLLAASLDADGNFSMEAFSTAGFRTVNGLLTFRCLPNMPAYHVSTNFDIQGPYFVTYPGPGQFYVALEEALTALDEGSIEIALVGGVAHQRNFLVESHFARIEPPVPPDHLADAAGFLVLERDSLAAARGAVACAWLSDFSVCYGARDPFTETIELEDLIDGDESLLDYGAASLPVALSKAGPSGGEIPHSLRSRDGLTARSVWRLV
jgi:3-oxoacyl-(acyl-carrier-protein) synthase